MEVVRARLRHCGDCGRTPPVGRQAASLHFELLRCIREGQIQAHTSQKIDVIRTIQTVIRPRGDTTTDGDLRSAEQSACYYPCLDSRAGQRDQVADVASIERQLADALAFDNQADARRARLYQCGIRLNLDLFCHLTDFEYNIDHRTRVDLQNNSTLHESSETLQGCFQPIGTNCEVRQDIGSSLVRYRHSSDARLGLRCRNFHTGQ